MRDHLRLVGVYFMTFGDISSHLTVIAPKTLWRQLLHPLSPQSMTPVVGAFWSSSTLKNDWSPRQSLIRWCFTKWIIYIYRCLYGLIARRQGGMT
jgi:hypothetical protein